MAEEIRRFGVTIPAGTAKSAGFTADLSFPARVVTEIEIRIPPGPRGEVGFAIGAAGTPVIPIQAGAYIVGNDEPISWPLEGFWDSGSWTFYGYNTGRYPHTIEVRFLVDLPQESGAANQAALQASTPPAPVGLGLTSLAPVFTEVAPAQPTPAVAAVFSSSSSGGM